MAIEFVRCKFVKRSEGHNACHKAAYIDRAQLEFEGTKFQARRVYDFSNREKPVLTKMILPEGVDEKFKDPKILWNAVEQAEKRHDSQVQLEYAVALPADKVITEKDWEVLMDRFSQEFFVKRGLAVHYAIHREDSLDHNPHGHLLVTTRGFAEDGKSLSPHKHLDIPDMVNPKKTDLQAIWIKIQNDYFKEIGLDLTVDPRGVVPQTHLGPVRLRTDLRNIENIDLTPYHGRWLERLQEYDARLELNAKQAQVPAKILKALTKNNSVFYPEDVDRFLAKHTPTDKIEAVKELFWKQDALVQLLDEERHNPLEKFTSKEVIEEEERIFRYCIRIQNREFDTIKEKHLDKFTWSFNKEQMEAIAKLNTSDGLSLLQGYAGTGKSYVLQALKDAYESCGFTVRGFGPDNATVKLLKDKNFQNAENIPRFLYAKHHNVRDIQKRELWIVDEAGKLGNQAFSELTRLADKHKAKLVLAGDGAQMSSVDRGGMFQYLSKTLSAAELKGIQRQELESQREITTAFSKNEIAKGVDWLQKGGHLHFDHSKIASMDKLMRKWAMDLHKNGHEIKKTLVIGTSARETRALNQAAHDIRHAQGLVEKEEFSCKTLFGEVIASKGDFIEFRKNDRDLAVINGMRGELIKAEEERFTVKIFQEDKDNDKVAKIVSFDPKGYGAWQLGYATTTYRSQGKTVERAYCLHSPMSAKQTAYVALSRHIKNVDYYISEKECSSIENLKKQISSDYERGNTLEFTTQEKLEIEKQEKDFQAELSCMRRYDGVKGKCKAFFKSYAHDIKEVWSDMQQAKQDRKEPQEFYSYDSTKDQLSEEIKLGVSKLENHTYDLNLSKGALKELDQYKQLEQEKALRQDVMQEKLTNYLDRCQTNDHAPIQNSERIFNPENERSIIVLCASQEAANAATENCKQEGFVFLSLERDVQDTTIEKELDLSALEERKLLVCGSEMERLGILEQLDKNNNLHVQTTDYDFVAANEFEFEAWQDAEVVRGDWQEVDDLEKKLDIQLGIEKEQDNQRGFDLSL